MACPGNAIIFDAMVTVSRVRQKEAEEEERSRDDLDYRMDTVLTLKRNIETNKENLRALQARDAKLAREREEVEDLEREELLAQGLNPDELMTRRKRIQQFERDKEAFEKRQRERQEKWSGGRLVAVSSDDDDDFSPYGETSRDEAKAGDSDVDITEDMAEPEFKGLWEDDNDKVGYDGLPVSVVDLHKCNGAAKKPIKARFTAHVPTTMEQVSYSE
ncbi:hypothetical protein QZH41_004145 [Actinostola sp. cb2023]|nr:hypothetical protein QZH41_004145 [Actinostola sp. cb2023]